MKQVIKDVVSLLFLISGFVVLFVLMQAKHIWGDIYVEQILINLQENTISSVSRKILYGFLISAILGLVTAVAFSVIFKKNKHLLLTGLICYLFVFWQAGVFSYVFQRSVKSKIYEKEYVFPQNLNYTFLQKKRNLIVVYLESMEANYAYDTDKNLIADIYAKMQTELSFDGFYQLKHQDYTMAAMVGSLCGVPLKKSILKGHIGYQNFLAGLVCLPQILQQNGYKTVFMKGADIDFSRTRLFMETHGFEDVMGKAELAKKFGFDLKENEGAFGGYRDSTLYETVKKELAELSTQKKPFFLSFLTLDMHTPDYFLSPVCTPKTNDKKDVIMCANQMLKDFLSWLEKQPFYQNTTVVVLADHVQTGKNELYPNNLRRQIVNFILNPSPVFKKQPHTAWTTLDAAPTILNALGVRFGNGSFGLGRSLLSKEPTLLEKNGLKFETELAKSSKVYDTFERVKILTEPKYYVYAPFAFEICSAEEIEKYATFSNTVMGVVYSDEFSFTLPQQESREIIVDLKFKVMLGHKGKVEINVSANGKNLEKWVVKASNQQPISKKLRIGKEIVSDNKLLLKFETDEQDSFGEAIGIGLMSLKMTAKY